MAYSNSLQFRKVLYCLFFSGQLLYGMGIYPLVVQGQPLIVYSDSLRAEQLLDRGIGLRTSGKYIQANSLLGKSAHLFLQSGYPFRAAHCYNHISSNFRMAGKPDSASVYARRALNVTRGLPSDNYTEQVRSYTNLGLIASERARYDSAMDWLSKAYQIIDHPSVSPFLKTTVLGSLGFVLDDLGNYDEALSYYNESLDILAGMDDPPKSRMAKLYNNIGYTYKNKGLYNRSLEFYKRELALNLEIRDDMHPDVAIAYVNIGAGYYRKGDYGQAALYFQKSLEASLNAFGEEHDMIPINYENLALCYLESGQYDKAIANLEHSALIKKRIRGPDHPELAITYKYFGRAYASQKMYRQALNYNKQALDLQRRSLGEDHPKLVDTYNKTGNYFTLQNQPDSALYYLNKAEDLALSALDSDHPALSYTYTVRAKISEANKQYDRAQALYRKALSIISEGPGDPSNASIQYPIIAVDILFDKARMLNAAYSDRGDVSYLEASFSTYNTLSGLLDKIQTGYINEQSKLTIGKRSHGIYEHAIQTAYKLHQETADPSYLEHVYFFAEKSKARILLESVVRNGAKQYSSIPDSLLSYERSLEGQMNALRQEMDLQVSGLSEGNSTLSSLRDSLIILNRKLAKYKESLNLRYPRYHALKFANHIPSVSRIQNQLGRKNLTVLEYFLGENSLFAILISEHDLNVIKLAYDSGLTDRLHSFNRAITHRSDSLYRALGSSLYQTLVKPIESLIPSSKQLLIIPDGAIALLPFEALLTHDVPEPFSSPRDLPFMLRLYDIAYAPSLALSSTLQSRKDRTFKNNLVAFAPGFTDDSPAWEDHAGIIERSSWKSLPFSRLEVTEIASLFDSRQGFWNYLFGGGQAKMYLDKGASETALKNTDALDARYIHLATHAFVSGNQTELAGILLYPDKTSNEDGILFAHEIYGLTMNTDLVVLSACETGKGSVVEGEGIMSLSRAFQYAGAENLLVSLWKVEDRSSARLMVEFYRSLVNGDKKISALQEAKKSLIQGVEYAHPFYWAPFILIGS